MIAITTIGRIAEHLVKMVALRSDAQILLTERPGMILHAVLLLLDISIGECDDCGSLSRRTSCSDRGIFLSFILWTPADTEPSSAVPARIRLAFMIAETRRVEGDNMGIR